MTRLMGDAIHDQVPALATVPGLQLVAGYVTGSLDIQWTAQDWARFPSIPHVSIDQAYTGSPVADANVRDVEPGAWTPGNAVNRAGWAAPRPTIYCNQYDLSRTDGVLASGWHGDVWLAIPGWQPGQPLPAAPGCTIVAVQANYNNPAYDLSYVLDPVWPSKASHEEEETMLIITGASGAGYLLAGGRLHRIQGWDQAALYEAAGVQKTGPVSAAEEAALLADFPAGNPAVTVNVPPVTVNPVAYTVTPVAPA